MSPLPVIYRLPVSGNRPIRFSVSNLPQGLTLDAEKGVIAGTLDKRGDYVLDITAENEKGKAKAQLTIRVGNTIGLTPPMGWNSWNCWGLSVTQEKVISSAQALIDKGLADYKRILRETPDIPISKLSKMCGFESRNSFYRQFSNTEGMKLSEWIKSLTPNE